MPSKDNDNDLRKKRLSSVRKRKLSEKGDRDEGRERPSRRADSPRSDRRKAKRKLGRRKGQGFGQDRDRGFAGRRDGSKQPFQERFADRRESLQGDRPESPGDGTILETIKARMKERFAQQGGPGQGGPGQAPGQPPVKDFGGSGPFNPDGAGVARNRLEQQGIDAPQVRPEAQFQPQPGLAPGQPIQSGQPAQPQPTNLDQVNAYDAAPVYAQPQPAPAPVQPQPAPAPAPVLPQPAPVAQPQPAPAPVAQPGYQPGSDFQLPPAQGVAQQVLDQQRRLRIRPDGTIDDGQQGPPVA